MLHCNAINTVKLTLLVTNKNYCYYAYGIIYDLPLLIIHCTVLQKTPYASAVQYHSLAN